MGKSWYDGFVFGNTHDIYNPWSITNFLDKKQVRPYWADTSSNSMIDELIRKASTDIKEKMEELLQGKEIVVNFDEQIVFEQLDQDENAIWSLMLVSGYLKAEQIEYRGVLLEADGIICESPIWKQQQCLQLCLKDGSQRINPIIISS